MGGTVFVEQMHKRSVKWHVLKACFWVALSGLVFSLGCGSAATNPDTDFRPQGSSGSTTGDTAGSTGTTRTTPHRIFSVTSFVSGEDVEIKWSTDEAATSSVTYGAVGGPTKTESSSDKVILHSVMLRGLLEGNYRFTVRSTFADGTEMTDDNGGAAYTFRVASLPLITNVSSSFDETTHELVVRWETNVPANSRVDVGRGNFDLLSAQSDTLTTTHDVRVAIAEAGDYVFRIVSVDDTGDMVIADNNGDGYPFTVVGNTANGTTANPILINVNSLPSTFSDSTRNTQDSTQSDFDSYPPASQQERGPEFVYRFVLTTSAKMTASVSDVGAVDIDIHLLSSLSPLTLFNNSAASRHDSTLSNITLPAGTYYLVLDSFGPDASKAGAYSLNVSFASAGGTTGNTCTNSTRPTPNGIPTEAQLDDSCPKGMVRVPASPAFCIDKYEAALIGVNANSSLFAWSPYSNPGTQKTKAVSVAGVVPQGYISRNQAEAACTNAGKRLCDSTEWMRACQSSQGYTYPYGHNAGGDQRQPGVCNDARGNHPAVEYFGANDPDTFSKLGHPCINQLPNSLGNTGSRVGCIAVDGPVDMMGNLHEWVDDLVASGPREGNGIFRGGYYVDTKINGNGCEYRTTAHAPSHWDYSTGFRCCAQSN